MKQTKAILCQANRKKSMDAIDLVSASIQEIKPYNSLKTYTPKEREPYDALSDRFIRAVEISLKFFRTFEDYSYGEFSQTTRDLLNRMEKLGLISATLEWMEMRDLRNRIVHDYLPEEIQKIYDMIIDRYSKELKQTKSRIENLTFEQ